MKPTLTKIMAGIHLFLLMELQFLLVVSGISSGGAGISSSSGGTGTSCGGAGITSDVFLCAMDHSSYVI